MSEYLLDFFSNRDECGPAFVAILAHPKVTIDDLTRSNLHASLCNLFYRSRAELDENWAKTPQSIKPIYAFRNPKSIERDLRKLKRLLRDRMIAAKMGMAYLQELELGPSFKLPNCMARLSLNELSFHVMSDLETEEPCNIETRIWRESLPVIHLATATALVIDQLEKKGVANTSIGHLITYPELVKKIIDISHGHASMLLKSTKLSIKPESLIQIYTK